MKILGISGSCRKDESSGTHTLVQAVLENTGMEYELISLRGKMISGCIACLECVGDNICKVKDDMAPLREKIVEADAYVVGAPNCYSMLNAVTHAFLERWFQFRHQEGNLLWGKLGVAVGVGGMNGDLPAGDIERFFMYSFIETVASVTGQGAASCYSCGYGETCGVGVPTMLYGENIKITPDMVPAVTKQPDVMSAAAEAGRLLSRRLSAGHERSQVTLNMQAKMMQLLGSNT
jgi:multimeric flavodoxin WrbA